MNTKIKICGIRRIDAAKAAVRAGADFIGFNFVFTSKRFIKPESAKDIIRQLTEQMRNRIKIVGVFQNEKVKEVNNIVNYLQLDCIQLHGEENSQYCQSVKTKVIKTIGLSNNFDLDRTIKLIQSYKVEYFLLDRIIQGKGAMIDFDKAKELGQLFPIFFAGGLNCNNVFEVIKKVNPYAVDVASGIETDGKEDVEKIKEFIRRVKKLSFLRMQGYSPATREIQ